MKIYTLLYSNPTKSYIVGVRTSKDDILKVQHAYSGMLNDACLSIEEYDTNVDKLYWVVQFDSKGQVFEIWAETEQDHCWGDVVDVGNDDLRIAVKASSAPEAIEKAQKIRKEKYPIPSEK